MSFAGTALLVLIFFLLVAPKAEAVIKRVNINNAFIDTP
jgi:hypothetical protein